MFDKTRKALHEYSPFTIVQQQTWFYECLNHIGIRNDALKHTHVYGGVQKAWNNFPPLDNFELFYPKKTISEVSLESSICSTTPKLNYLYKIINKMHF